MPDDIQALEQWLLTRALEHEAALLLFQMACDWLRQKQLLRIGTTRLEKLVATVRSQAQESLYDALKSLLSEDVCTFLDGLLEVDETLKRTRLSWLQRTPTDNNPKQILETLEKLRFLQEQGVAHWELSALNPNHLNHLAKIGARATNQALQRSHPVRRYPLLLAFLKQALYGFTDDVIEMVDQRLWELYNAAKRQFDADRLQATRTLNEKLKTFKNLGAILLDESVDDQTVRATVFAYISPEQLQSSLAEAEKLIRPEEDAYVDYFCQCYRRVRRFSTQFLATLEFQARGDDLGLLDALQLIHEIHQGQRRKLPDTAPTDFIPKSWRAYVLETEPSNWRDYELAALWVLRQQLRSGDIYLLQSRRFSELATYLIPETDWPVKRQELVRLTGTPTEAGTRLQEREQELQALMAQVESLLADGDSDLREEDERLVLSPIVAEEKALALKQLIHTISERLPRLDITDLLIEVDNWTQFSKALEHLHAPNPRDTSALQHLSRAYWHSAATWISSRWRPPLAWPIAA